MAKKSLWLSAFATALVIAAAGTVITSGAYAQSGGDDDAVQEQPAAKKSPVPPPIDIHGTWNGTIQDNIKGPGTISLTLTQKSSTKKGTLKGSWMVSFPDTAPFGVVNDFGTVTGSVLGSAVVITMKPAKGDDIGCSNIIHSTEATAQMISGTFTACGHTGTIDIQPGPVPSTVFINIGDDYFSPNNLTISAGQTVRWTNNGHEDHTVTANTPSTKCSKVFSSDPIDSPDLGSGTIFEHTFNNKGAFGYFCKVHGCPMKGTVTVQ